MKYISLVTLLFILSTTHSHACQLTMQAGPYLTPDFVKHIFSDFIKAVEKDTQCTLDIRLASSLEGYIKSILKGGADIFIFGEQSIPAFTKRGFSPVIKTKGILKSLTVINPNRVDINKGETMLYGKTIITPSPYSLASMHFHQYIKEQDLTDKISLRVQENYTLNTLDFIKGEIDAMVVLNFVYKTLPDYVHKKFKVVLESELNSVIMYGKSSLDSIIIDSLKSNVTRFTDGDWEVFKSHRNNQFSQEFEKRISNLESRIKPQS